MSLTPNEAAESLKTVADAQRHSLQAYGYSLSAPYFFVWGVVWALGYGASAIFQGSRDGRANWIWLALVAGGCVAVALIGRSQKRQHARSGWRIWAATAVAYAFSFAIFFLMHPINGLQVGAYWPLLVASIYTALGLWMGMRYVATGVAVFAATLGGYFFLHDYFFLWMAIVGSGALILTGFWLRRA